MSQETGNSTREAGRLNILLDGYNLEMPGGTGIKRYGMNLLRALHDMGHTCGCLFSRTGPTKDPLLMECLLNDCSSPTKEPSLLFRLRRKMQLMRRGLSLAVRPQSITAVPAMHRVEPTDSYMRLLDYYSASPAIYNASIALHAHTGKMTELSLPQDVDVWHATTLMPVVSKRAANIVTVHDLIPLLFPLYTKDRKAAFYAMAKDMLRRVDGILTVSQSTKSDLVSLLGVPEERIRVTYQPVHIGQPMLSSENLASYLRMYGLMPGQYFLFVGAWEPKKNLGRLFQAVLSLQPKIPLVMVGGSVWPSQEELALADRLTEKKLLIRLGRLPDELLPALFQGARFSVFPSLYEGFGLPPLEGMTYGCPAMVSNRGSLSEICGQAAEYVDPTRLLDMVAVLENLLRNDARIEELRSHAQAAVDAMSPELHMERLGKAYRDFLS